MLDLLIRSDQVVTPHGVGAWDTHGLIRIGMNAIK